MKILITQLGTLGDMILLTPLFRLLKENLPKAEIHVLSGRRSRFALESNPYISKMFIHDKSPVKLLKNIFLLRKTKYDFYIDPKDHYSREGAMLARLIRAKVKIGFGEPFDKQVASSSDNAEIHFLQACLHPLKHLRINAYGTEKLKPELYSNSNSLTYAREFIRDFALPAVAVNISAGKSSCLWEENKWIEFLNSAKDSSAEFVLLSATPEKEEALRISAQTGIRLFNSRNVNDIVSLVSLAEAVITVDTAVAHIAAAWNKPLLGLYKKSSYFTPRFYPLSDIKLIVESDENDAPISGISVEKVIEAWRDLKKIYKTSGELNG